MDDDEVDQFGGEDNGDCDDCGVFSVCSPCSPLCSSQMFVLSSKHTQLCHALQWLGLSKVLQSAACLVRMLKND